MHQKKSRRSYLLLLLVHHLFLLPRRFKASLHFAPASIFFFFLGWGLWVRALFFGFVGNLDISLEEAVLI